MVSKKIITLIWVIESSLWKEYFMNPGFSAIKTIFFVLYVISLFTAKKRNQTFFECDKSIIFVRSGTYSYFYSFNVVGFC